MPHPACRTRRHGRALGATLLLLLLPVATLRAQVTTFTSLSAWLAAVSAPGVDTFNDLALSAANPPSSVSRSAGLYQYVARAEGGLFAVGPAPDLWLSTNLATDPLIFDTFSSTVRGVGGFFFGTDIGGSPVQAGTLQLAWVTGAGSGTVNLTNPTPGTFFGLVSTAPVTSLTVRDASESGSYWPTANDLRLATIAPTATVVPEPATVLLLAAGLGAVALRRRHG